MRPLLLLFLFAAVACGAPPKAADAPNDVAGDEGVDMIDVDDEIDERSVDGTETNVDEDVRLSDKERATHDDAGDAEATTPSVMKHTKQSKSANEDEEDDDPAGRKKKRP